MSTTKTGQKVGSYRIGEEIGGGAMGRVWRGVDEALGRPVAVKMLRTELAERQGLIDRFRVEAQVLARLSHPNIAMVFALVEESEDLYLVMEYVEGETLNAQLKRRGPLDLETCFRLFHQALDGIQHAHEAGVVHRDIKPSNLMLDAQGQVKWIDFGIAHVRGHERMTRAGGLVGTPAYMAPEQVRGDAGTIRSDIYSLGIALYKMLTGKLPFTASGEFDVMRAQVEAPPPRPSAHGVPIDRRIEDVLLRALAKDPAARFASALAFQRALVDAGAPAMGRTGSSGPVAGAVGAGREVHEATRVDPAESPTVHATRPILDAVLADPGFEPLAETKVIPGEATTLEAAGPEHETAMTLALAPSLAEASTVRDLPPIELISLARSRAQRRAWWGVALLAACLGAALNWIALSRLPGPEDPTRRPGAALVREAPQGRPEATAQGGALAGVARVDDRASPPSDATASPAPASRQPAARSGSSKRVRRDGWEITR